MQATHETSSMPMPGGGPGSGRFGGMVRDTMFLTVDRVAQILTTIICTGLVGRSVGVEAFGYWQLAMLSLFMLVALANVATGELTIPRMVEGADEPRKTLAAVWTVRWATVALIGAATAVVLVAGGLSSTTGWLLLLLLPSMMREPGLAMQFWHTARKTVRPYLVASVVTLVLRLALTVAVFLAGLDLEWFVAPVLAENLLYFVLFRRQFVAATQGERASFRAALAWLRPTQLFWSWAAMVATLVSLRIDRFVLPSFMDDRNFGLYTAALQMSDNWFFVGVLLSGTIGTAYVYSAKTDAQAVRQGIVWATAVAVLVTIGSLIAIVLAPLIIAIVFGAEFSGATPILVWSMPALALVPVNMIASLPIVRARRLDLIALKGVTAAATVAGLVVAMGDSADPRLAVLCVAAGQVVSIGLTLAMLYWLAKGRMEAR